MNGEGPAHAQGMLVYALWLENPDVFEQACRLYLTEDGRDDFNKYMKAARDILVHGRKAAARKFLKSYPPPGRKPLNEQFDQAVFGATVARLSDAADAKKRHAHARKLLAEADQSRCMSTLARAMHYRNVLLLGPRKERAVAREFFRSQLAAGYGCFTEIAVELG
jgi:hypothetical protein